MKLDYEQIIQIVTDKIDDLEKSTGEEFLELVITEIRLYDKDDDLLDTLAGLEYGLIRSRHWDKDETLILHNGISEENLFDCLEDLDFPEETDDVKLHFSCDGMTDLEEPLSFEFEIKINYGK